MITVDNLNDEIKKMGYVIAIPRGTPIPSFYKLADGTILSAMIVVNHALQNPSKPDILSINNGISLKTFVPSSKRDLNKKRLAAQTGSIASIVDEDVQYETLHERFNEYNLSNGAVLGVKTIIGQVQKTALCNNQGEPIYNVDTQPMFKIKQK